MRLCHVVASLETRYGGPSKSVYSVGVALAALGNEVELLATDPTENRETKDGRLQVEIFRRDWPRALCPSTGLRTRLSQSEAKVIHNHGLWLRTLGYASQTARVKRLPLVISPRGMMGTWAWQHHRLRKRLAAALLHPGAFQLARGWHATSEQEVEDIRRLGFRAPICLAPNGVSPPGAAEADAQRRTWLQLVPQANDRRIALFYSRLHSKKRVRELMQLWKENQPAGWHLLVVGIPEEYDAAGLSAYAAELGAVGEITVLSGLDHPAPYAIASLFILPSHNENFGMSIAEAMTHRVPVLVTDTTPWSAANSHGAGWCVPWSSFGRALAAAVAESPDSLAQRGVRARDWVLAEFSWERSARLLEAFYRAL